VSLITDRFDASIVKLGETISWTMLNGSAIGQPFSHPAICRPLTSSEASTFLDDVERMSISHPGLYMTVKSSLSVIANDTFGRDGRSYTVLRVFSNKNGSDVVTKTVIALA
jgi:hypothetical protein